MKLTKSCAKFLRKHGGTMLAVLASAGVVLTAIETGKATVKAEKLIEMNRMNVEVADGITLTNYTVREKVQDCWKFYIPAVVVGAGTVACILGSNALNKKQLASMTAAYMALGKTYQEYRRQVIQHTSAEQEKDIYADTQEVLKQPSPDKTNEKLLCYEPISKRYFHATEAELADAFYNLNRDFALNAYASMNDLYNYLGLDYTPEGETKGWCGDYLANEWEYFWIDFSYFKQRTDNGLEVYYVSALQEPIDNYLDYDPNKEPF